MNYTYVLLSERDGRFFAGSTIDLRARFREHTAGRVRSTASRAPLVLIYYEACVNLEDARRRERFLKTGKGKRYLNNRLAAYLSGIRRNELERH
ncbi:GIY-YIG nuclease family protein [Candidatus Methylomirabilis sp.]|uniref:GIY-YIG nuclease family protein n=1 Tax=Candidatus Methylomirabilis sp. TaxID=2032687 RepID=UPI003C71A38A